MSAGKQRGRAGELSPARSHTGTTPQAEVKESQPVMLSNDRSEKENNVMATYGSRAQTQMEGVTVIGEAVWRVPPERAEFLIEITSSAPSAAQALHDNQLKLAQVAQVVAPLGVQQGDLQTISLNVYNFYTPAAPALSPYGGIPAIGSGGFPPYAAGAGLVPAEIQSAAYHARNLLRVKVGDPRRLGEIVDAIARAGAVIVGSLSVGVSDEAGARRHALEAAGKDARSKADALAVAAGKQVEDAVAIAEDIIATNGVYAALRSAVPFAFGAGAPQVAGELEYYARVSASFRLK
jgi:uncharacterized protein YggE